MPEFNIIAEYIPSRTITAQFIPVNFDIPAKLVEKTIQANGVYNASEDNVDGYSSVTVVVPDRPLMVQELNVTPSTESQTINIISGIDGYGPVKVSAVTSNIDSNIKSSNIKEGVSILGVVGNVVGLNGSTTTINPSTSSQTVAPTAPSNGFTEVTVPAVTSAIDPNIQPDNIIKGKSILGVDGTFYGLKKEIKSGSGILKYLSYDTQSTNIIDLSGIGGIDYGQLMRAYMGNNNLTTINMSGIKHVLPYSLYETFCECQNITSVDLSSIESIAYDYACYGMCNGSGISSVNLSSVQSITGDYACTYMFRNCTRLNSLNLSLLTTVRGSRVLNYVCSGCSSLTSINLDALVKIDGAYACSYSFEGCTGLTSVSMKSLVIVGGTQACNYMFTGCSNIATADLSSLTSIVGTGGCSAMFLDCSSLSNMTFYSLSVITPSNSLGSAFKNCTSLRTVSFPALYSASFGRYTNQFANLVEGVTGCTLHFPSNMQAKIAGLTGYPNFGGTNTTVLFDLPATLTLTGADSVTYTRNPKHDTGTALAWKAAVYGDATFTPYYTTGTTDPQVGDTLYSDSACTQTVTTIGAIA